MSADLTVSSTLPTRRPRTGIALALLVAAQAMVLIDDMIVNIAIPGISTALATSPVQLSWVVNAYLLTFGGLLLLGGRAGDILGRRRVFLAGVGLFTLASLVRGLAPNAEFLIAARAVQGVGAALVAPSVLALIVGMYREGPQRKRAIAVYTAVGGLGAAGGLLLAGIFTSVGSWRWVLMLNVPVGVLILALAPVVVRETARRPGHFDVAGALTSAFGIAALVWALSAIGSGGWSAPEVRVGLVTGLALIGVFVLVERRARQPIMPPRLVADRQRGTAYLAVLLVQGSQIGQLYFLTQFMQQGMGFSPMAAALAFLPVTVTLLALSGAVVKLEPRLGARPLVATGAVLLAGSNLLLADLDFAAFYPTDILPALLLLGAGIALGTIPATIAGTTGVDDTEYGSASSIVTTVTSVGASLALATLVTVMTEASANVEDPAAVASGAAFVTGMSAAFVAAAGFAAATFVAGLFLPGRKAS
ncbi:MFS transporter [Saccharopolyspora sp. 5N708]|uniref:MFS transporter n=1 Tax=Saccharopolyspora sp. 5N708 TaxID=3457424 RepID=UPI003FD31D61